MKNKICIILSVLNGVLGMLSARADRTLRNELRAATETAVHAAYDRRLKEAQTLEAIAGAQRESSALTREALIACWAQREAKRLERDTMRGRFAHAYAAPAWPAALSRFFGTHSLSTAYSIAHGENGFDARGDVVDASVVRFSKMPLLKDMLLASKLAATAGATTGVGYEFLSDLSNVAFPFQVSTTTHECALTYALSFAHNAFQCGVRVPIRYQTRHLEAISRLSSADRTLLRVTTEDEELRNSSFRNFYGISVPDFVADLVAQKGMEFRQRFSETTLADLSLFATVHWSPWRLDRVSLSAEVLVPAEKAVNTTVFYPFMPESQGCLSGRLSIGLVAKKTVIGAPHFMASWRTYAPASVLQRVPRLVTAAGASSLASADLFGDEVTFDPARDIAEPETILPDFASGAAAATIRPGFAVDARIGTVVTPFLLPLLQCDFYYHFHMRGSDELRQGLAVDKWHAVPLLAPPYRAQHRLGLWCSYQPAKGVSMNVGFEAVVAGRSQPLEVKTTIALSRAW